MLLGESARRSLLLLQIPDQGAFPQDVVDPKDFHPVYPKVTRNMLGNIVINKRISQQINQLYKIKSN